MHRCLSTLAVMAVFLVATWGQQISGQSSPSAQNATNVCRVYFTKPKPGMETQWEQARQKHVQFHKQHNDIWTWYAYQVVTGENTGVYVVSTCGHSWKDFDDWDKKMGKADAADALAGMGPFEQSNTNSFDIYRADLSLAPPNNPPAPMSSVSVRMLHPGAQDNFTAAVTKINAALMKQPNWPKTSGWLQLANGGEGPTMVLISGRRGWADYAPLKKTVLEAVTEAYGKEEADAILKVMVDSTAHVFTETAVYRPDLSYLPK